jgi:hypothetical protein
MSHNKIRTEKNCLNCGETVEERYCPNCGQENIELHDSALHLFIHFVQDIFHYDGKWWHTLRGLIRKPGLVAAEYLDGKRVINIQPIRFYILTSTVFFLVLFYIFKPDENTGNHNPIVELNKRMHFLKKEKKERAIKGDTLEINALIETLQCEIDSLNPSESDTSTARTENNNTNFNFGLGTEESNTPDNLDSLGWFERFLLKRTEERRKEVEEKHQGDTNQGWTDLLVEVFHKLPQLIFLSLPFFAFFLKLLYFHSPRKLYVEHLIFSIYQYSYLYFLLTCFVILSWITDKTGNETLSDTVGYLNGFLTLYLFIYLALAMKRFYGGRKRYLILKYGILMFMMFFTLLFLFILIAVVTFLA